MSDAAGRIVRTERLPAGTDLRERAPQPPEPVRALFGEMRVAASAFARAAREAQRTGDSTPAWKSLAVLGGYCSACHAAYRLQ